MSKKKIEKLIHTIEPEELLPDDTLLCSFTIPGKPYPKKTGQRIMKKNGHPFIMQSANYVKYEAHCKSFCENAWMKKGKKPMNFGISVQLRVCHATWQFSDWINVAQGIADCLQKYGIIANDKLIHWTDTSGNIINHSFLGVDSEKTRVEIEVRRKYHPYEQYRKEQEENEARLEIKRAERLIKKIKTSENEI